MSDPTVVVLDQAAHEEERLRPALQEHLPAVDPVFAHTRERSLAAIEDAEIALTFDLADEQLDRARELEWVQALSAGVGSFPSDALAERGIALTNCSGIHGEQIGEQVLGYMLVFERRIHEGIRQQRAGEWEPYEGGELRDGTLGIVGVGAIGERVAEFGASLGMKVLGIKRDTAATVDPVDELYGPADLPTVLERSDYVVLTCPLTPETREMIGAAELDRMGEDAVLVNVARGEVVDEDALIDALEAGTIGGAALDVFEEEPLPEDSPLREHPEVVTTPHVAGRSPHYFDRAVELFARNYRAFVGGDSLENRIV